MRCDKHSLACGPDGRCVLCRREGVPGKGPSLAPPASPAPRGRLAVLVTAGVLLVAGAALGARMIGSPARADAPPSIQLGIQGATTPMGSAPVRAATTAAATPPPGDDPRTRWMRAVAQGTPSPSSEEPGTGTPASAGEAVTTPPPSWREASRDVHVVVYTTGWCPHCREAKAWMRANGVSYDERDIEASSDNARENRSVNPRGSIPTFDVDGDVMVGFSAGGLTSMIERAAQRRSRRN